ncbi:hypothetical protein QCA50_012511 [Cerrena zonata]|uniref:ATP synthase subunit e, mitochondrial n=1 Tax=Cerrena zonata TaxID=2478898 RepID=A0AAW0G2E9_9APHY
MNTPQSMFLGWGSLIVAAGASYYWAKKGIDERRSQQAKAGSRPTDKLDWRARIEKQKESPAPVSASVTAVAEAEGGRDASEANVSLGKKNPP